jgi:hypothetical protein
MLAMAKELFDLVEAGDRQRAEPDLALPTRRMRTACSNR